MAGSEQKEMLHVLCDQGYYTFQAFTCAQKTNMKLSKWNKNVSQTREKSPSKHTGTMPVTQDRAGLPTAGSISLECVSA